MKNRYLKVAAVLTVICLLVTVLAACNGSSYRDSALAERDTDELYIMSYNIRTLVPNPKEDADKWSVRKNALIGHIKQYSADVIGMQEVKYTQLKYFAKNLTGYSYVGRSRDRFKTIGEGVYIFYREDRLELLESETFWLSETPDKPSKDWDSSCRRTCVAAKLKDKRTGETFMFYNTHLDHKSENAREKGSELIASRMIESNLPSFVTGDFNFFESEAAYTLITTSLDNAKYIAAASEDTYTYNGYGTRADDSPIDYCFFTPDDFAVSSYEVLDEKFDGVYTSDHYSILIKAEINSGN